MIERIKLKGDPYQTFLAHKAHLSKGSGFRAIYLPDSLFDFQKSLVEWALLRGRSAIFADCGLGKTAMQLVWADNVVRKTNGRVLIGTPLAVSHQTIAEAEKFGIEGVKRSVDGKARSRIVVTNYEQLHKFDRDDFVGMVADESSILKCYDGARRGLITEFMKKLEYRLLCTATAAPNDYIELGTSSEALGELGFMDVLTRFFKNDRGTIDTKSRWGGQSGGAPKWRFKGHAQEPFWRWVSSWARALRKPSDLGFDDGKFQLPKLIEQEHKITPAKIASGYLLSPIAGNWREQQEERRRTIEERCEVVAGLVNGHKPALVWCHMNQEGDLLEKLIPGAVQVSGSDSDEHKEEALLGFATGKIDRLVTKPRIGGWGLNLQNCNYMTVFPSHSFEQYYQIVRRCWRFGQKRDVFVDLIRTDGDEAVLTNMRRKAAAADRMFTMLTRHMQEAQSLRPSGYDNSVEVPEWL
jgi:hypothetical protein